MRDAVSRRRDGKFIVIVISMPIVRIIPRLDIKGPNVVKGVQTEGLRVVGAPAELAKKYYAAGADEVVYMDIVASLYGRNLDLELLRSVAQTIFIPLTVGGGIRSVHDIENTLRAGADKIAINTAAIQNPTLLAESVAKFGAQCIVLSVEAKQIERGSWEAYTDGGRERSGRDALLWIDEALALGVGEILITSIDRDGTRRGFDLELARAVRARSSVPVIVHGGAGSLKSIAEVYTTAKPEAIALASVLHYNSATIAEIKTSLKANGATVRTE